MKQTLALLLVATGTLLHGQGLQVGFGGSLNVGGTANGSFVSTVSPQPQTTLGAVFSPYHGSSGPVPFNTMAAAFLGYGQISNEADIYSGGGGGLAVWTPNNLQTAWTNVLTLSNQGNLTPSGNYLLSPGNCLLWVPPQGICDDGAGGINYTTSPTAANGQSFFRGSNLQWQMDAAGNLKNGSGAIILPAGATGSSGTGNVLLSNGGTSANLVVGTQITGDNSTKAASTQFVQNSITAVGSGGVISINGAGGAYTFTGNVTCVGTTCTFTSTGIPNTTLALPGGLVAAPNKCYGWSGSAWVLRPPDGVGTAATFSMTGVVTSPIPSFIGSSWQGSPDQTAGWGKVGGLVLNPWASAANTVSWDVCNPTAGTITSGAPSFTIAAQ